MFCDAHATYLCRFVLTDVFVCMHVSVCMHVRTYVGVHKFMYACKFVCVFVHLYMQNVVMHVRWYGCLLLCVRLRMIFP